MKTSKLFLVTRAFLNDQSEDKNKVQVHQGGTSSGKTYSILQALFLFACENSRVIITVVGQDVPNLKVGAIRDALNIITDNPEIESQMLGCKLSIAYNRTDRKIYFANGSEFEFKSYLTAQGAKSGKRNILFVNEANGISWQIFNELYLRTKTNEAGVGSKVIIDYNPNAGFWAHEKLIDKPNVETIISDHRTNPFIDQDLRDKIEALRGQDVELWKVYGRGLTGRIEGLIFSNWVVVNAIPAGAKLLAYGLDFGFTNDETGFIEVYMQNGELWVNEVLYETGLTNPDISKKLKGAGISMNIEIVADSAEPKSIEELNRLGWYITGAMKGPDSIKNSIDILKRYRINVTRNSVNLRKELERYTWKKDKLGEKVNEPVDSYNHLIDPLRYVALNKLKIKNQKAPTSSLPRRTPPPMSGLPAGML